jgi:hypothetical protein
MPKSYRIRTEVGQDKFINVKLDQDFDHLEILSLKINQSEIYTRVCADYGVVVGRVLVNGGFGLPNAKVSVFVPLSEEDELDPIISELYPYKTLSDVNEDGYRYNLLPKDPSYSTHAATGTFPTREEVLLDQTYIEVYDKYYKFTVKTNDSGDYMIFGVPTGDQTIVMDVDLSDIGCFSLSPQDLVQAGVASPSQVNGNTFKTSTNLNELPQIKTLNKTIDIPPFWGDEDVCQFGITRVDFDLTKEANIRIEPTSVFMGSLISTTNDDALKTTCKPKNNTGNLCELIAGPGQILAIRQTIFPDEQNLPVLEEYKFEENGKVIDGDGSFLVNVPMNLDYVITNEFGEQVISNDPKKGIPTKGKYRFKFKWENQEGLQNEFLRANYLVPNVKEHGWSNSATDPFDPSSALIYAFNLPVGDLTGTTTSPGNGGFIFDESINSADYSIYIDGQPYFGDPNSIPISNGQTFEVVSNPIDDTQPQTITYKFLPQEYFDVLRSYTFSLDWDDYVDTQSAINCEDTFYEFNYNKVYTTSMFLDRYKNGLGRARHLGIKEIDDRSCKTTVNTFPVNDVIRNFDFIFFVFNVLINILAFPILVLLFIAHLISFIWPILKYLLIVLGLYLVYQSVVAGVEAITTAAENLNNALGVFSYGAGFVVNLTNILEVIRLTLLFVFIVAKAIFLAALAAAFLAFAIIAARRVKGFPRIGLPMISYPECNNCECQCGNAEMDDDFDADSVQEDIDSYAEDSGQSFATSNSFLAPVNLSGTYSKYQHPNLENIPSYDLTDANRGFFRGPSTCPPLYPLPPVGPGCKTNYNIRLWSLLNSVADDELDTGPVVRAQLDFLRLFSGYDVTSSGQQNYYQKAPQPFLFSGRKQFGNNKRWFGRPQKVPYPQKLNEFNTRDKYFNPAGGINRIQVTPNPSLGGDSYLDNVLVLLAKKGTTSNLGIGEVFTLSNSKNSNGQVNITGATLNQFGLNSVTGTTTTGTSITYPVTYANPGGGPGLTANIRIIQTGNTENYMQYMPDIEHFQVITGMTVGQYTGSSLNTAGYFKQAYLRHTISYSVVNENLSSVLTPPTTITGKKDNGDPVELQANNFVAIEGIENYETDYEVVILVRGVDPNTSKQTIKYDLSKIFGYTTPNTITVEGSYYLNIPIQPQVNSNLTTPKTHNTLDNALSTGVYFPSYTFTPSNDYSAFTSNNPYYYLSTDDPQTPNPLGGANYIPTTTHPLTVGDFNGTNGPLSANLDRVLPLNAQLQIPGGTFIAANFVATTSNPTNWYMTDSGAKANYGWPINNNAWNFYAIYSAAYYRYPNLNGVNFNNKNNIVMRSDRLPTSDCVENGIGSRTGYALHQNNNFCSYKTDGQLANPQQGVAADLPSGEQYDSEVEPGLIETLACEGMIPLECYSGSGNNVGVLPSDQCEIPEDRMINGCYCLLNKTYLLEYGNDARLFLEWKTRFTITFAACRGVFAHVFQNNWINGTLYMFTFNKTATYPANSVTNPTYKYCEDVILFNDINNGFYYRSSPWNGTDFIGKNPPLINPNIPSVLVNDYPGMGYNDKQIQFPTTIADLGPRENFISEICNNDNFNGYLIDRVRATSYQDTSDLIQLGFLSRILNDNFRQAIIPISNPAGDNTEGKGIIQFFNSERQGDRIDGDFAQMLSINSEWRISPFLTENYPNSDSIFFGDDTQSGQGYPRPVFGVFYESPEINYSYRRNLTPGVETLNFSPLLQYTYGYPKTQIVPHYKWKLQDESTNIFGNENNNWYTTPDQSPSGNGFYRRGYQDLDFNTTNEYFQTPTTQFGIITNFDVIGEPDPTRNNFSNVVIVGAPYHFYFGLNNGKTAIDKFIKLYITSEG